jgi:hypothetical protein
VGSAQARKPETDLLGLWKLGDAYDSYEREVPDLPCFEFRTTVVVELYRVRCPDLQGEDREGAAVAEQGAVQQALRRGGGVGL